MLSSGSDDCVDTLRIQTIGFAYERHELLVIHSPKHLVHGRCHAHDVDWLLTVPSPMRNRTHEHYQLNRLWKYGLHWTVFWSNKRDRTKSRPAETTTVFQSRPHADAMGGRGGRERCGPQNAGGRTRGHRDDLECGPTTMDLATAI